jgi:integrase
VNTQRGFLRRRGKTWTAYWYTETVDGRKQHTKGGFTMRKDAQVFLTDAMSAIGSGSFAEPVKVRFGEYLIEQWLPTRELQLRPSTYSSYEVMINKHVLPELGGVKIQQMTANHLDRFYAKLSKSGLSPKTVHNVHVMLHKALHDAVRKSLLPRNPAEAADPPSIKKADRGEMSIWTPEQVRTFFDGIAKHRLAAGYILSAITGMRRGEILGLRWSDIDFDEKLLVINQTVVSVNYEILTGGPKTAGSRRRLALDDQMLGILRAHQAVQQNARETVGTLYVDHGLVFARVDGGATHPDYFSQTFDRTVRRLALPKVRLHDLRHTNATIGLAAGVPIKIMSTRLGHATTAFTQDVYMRSTDSLERDAARRIAASVFGGSVDESADGQAF